MAKPSTAIEARRIVNLDTALLRTFVTVVEMGSLARAADLVARSQPAVSLQLKRLEEALGQSLFCKTGRKLGLTEAGALALTYARKLLDINDETVTAVSSLGVSGSIRLGIPQDFAEGFLTEVLARFARSRPSVVIEVRADRNAVLIDQLQRRRLDLALIFGESGQRSALLAQVPMVWLGSTRQVATAGTDQVPLVVFEPPCIFRQAAVDALQETGKRWRVSFSSPSLSSQWAAVEAGLGYCVRTPIGLRGPLRVLGRRDGFPPLKPIGLYLHAGTDKPDEAVRLLHTILTDTIRHNAAGRAFGSN